MTHLPLQDKNDSEVTSQPDSLHDSSVNYALIAIAQEVAELLKQAYPVQSAESELIEVIDSEQPYSIVSDPKARLLTLEESDKAL